MQRKWGDPEKALFRKFTIEYAKSNEEMLRSWEREVHEGVEAQHEHSAD